MVSYFDDMKKKKQNFINHLLHHMCTLFYFPFTYLISSQKHAVEDRVNIRRDAFVSSKIYILI